MTSVEVRTILITPDLARAWLQNNPNNRAVRPYKVREYANDISSGLWRVNGHTIVFDQNGALLDGQHRLEAVVMAQRSIECLVAFGIDRQTDDTIDRGMNRTIGDALKKDGVEYSTHTAAAVKIVIAYGENDIRAHRSGLVAGGHRAAMSASRIKQFIHANPNILVSVRLAYKAHLVLPSGIGGALHFLFSKISPSEADSFFEDLIRGASLKPSDPILVLREKLISNKRRRAKVDRGLMFYWTVIAWNKRRAGLPVTMIKIPVTREGEMVYPEIK